MKYDTILDIGKRKRQSNGINEDSLGTTTISTAHRDEKRESGIFVIADGAGGHQDGDVASYIATNTVLEELSSFMASAERRRPKSAGIKMQASITDDAPDGHELRAELENAIDKAHREILNYASEAKAEPLTTIVVALVYDGFIHYAWVGDSRAYIINPTHEQISLLTRDHSVVERMRQKGEVTDIEAEVHPDGNQITRALGGNQYDNPDMKPVDVDSGSVPLFKEDLLLITSDGLIDGWTDAPNYYPMLTNSSGKEKEAVKEEILKRSVTDDEIRDIVLNADSLESANKSLVNVANSRGGKDNMSIIITEPIVGNTSPDLLPARGIDEEESNVCDDETVIMQSEDSESDSNENTTTSSADQDESTASDEKNTETEQKDANNDSKDDSENKRSISDQVQEGAKQLTDRFKGKNSDQGN